MSSASREHPDSSSKYSGFTDTMSGLMLNLCVWVCVCVGGVCVCVCVCGVCVCVECGCVCVWSVCGVCVGGIILLQGTIIGSWNSLSNIIFRPKSNYIKLN